LIGSFNIPVLYNLVLLINHILFLEAYCCSLNLINFLNKELINFDLLKKTKKCQILNRICGVGALIAVVAGQSVSTKR